jgi:hypothetical protein
MSRPIWLQLMMLSTTTLTHEQVDNLVIIYREHYIMLIEALRDKIEEVESQKEIGKLSPIQLQEMVMSSTMSTHEQVVNFVAIHTENSTILIAALRKKLRRIS